MKKTFLHRLHRPLGSISAAALLMLVATHTPVLAAAEVEGCNPAVREAQEKVAELKVAKYVADVEEVVTQPESTTALTCFNQSAATAAQEGGAIFSGDFTDSLAPVITTSLNAFYDDFADAAGFQSFLGDIGLDAGEISAYLSGAIGTGLTNALGQSGATLAGGVLNGALNFFGSSNPSVGGILSGVTNGIAYNTQIDGQTSNDPAVQCNGIKGLWDKIQGKGITKKLPQLSLKDLMDGPANTAIAGMTNSKFLKNWQANDTSGIFTAAVNAMAPLVPAPTINYGGATSSCQVLVMAGVLPNGTQCPN